MSTALPLNEESLDILTELVNIGVGRAAASLSDLIGMRVDLTVPRVRLDRVDHPCFESEDGSQPGATVVIQEFQGAISGRSALVLPQASGLSLAHLLIGAEEVSDELDVELTGVLLEVGNILLNSVMGSLANAVQDNLEYTVPELTPCPVPGMNASGEGTECLVADVHFSVLDREIAGSVVIIFTWGSVQTLIESFATQTAELATV